MSPKTNEHITWHQPHDAVDKVMMNPSYSEAWKHYNCVYPQFLVELRNVCLELYTNGFNPFSLFPAPYSC
jgi:hypothetical protein